MQLFIQIISRVKIKLIDKNRLINRLITNKLLSDLFSYLSYSYLISKFYLFCYLVFISINSFISYNILLFFSYSIPFFISINSFLSCSAQYFVSSSVLSFVNIKGFISCNVQYQAFFFISNHFNRFISNFKSLLDYLISPRSYRSFYLYRAS